MHAIDFGLHKDDLTTCLFHPALNGGGSAGPSTAAQSANLRKLPSQAGGDFVRLVGGTVIDNQNFKPGRQIGQHIEELTDPPCESLIYVVNRKNDAE